MFALILTPATVPIPIGSSRPGWFTLAGMISRPRATSARTTSASSASRSATRRIAGVSLAAAGGVHLGDTFAHGALRWPKENAFPAGRGAAGKASLSLKVTPYAGLNRVRFKGSDLSPPWRAPPSTISN